MQALYSLGRLTGTPCGLQVFAPVCGHRVHDALLVNKMEQLLVQELNWELSSVVPVAYVAHLFCLLHPYPSPLDSHSSTTSTPSPERQGSRYSHATSNPAERAAQADWSRTLGRLWGCVQAILFYCLMGACVPRR